MTHEDAVAEFFRRRENNPLPRKPKLVELEIVRLELAAGVITAALDADEDTLYVERDGPDVRELAAILATAPEVWADLRQLASGSSLDEESLGRETRQALALFVRH